MDATAMEHKQLRIGITGGAEGNRTPDLLNAIQALSQLSYSPRVRWAENYEAGAPGSTELN